MATVDTSKQQKTGTQSTLGGDVGSPICNEAYNVIAALHAKLEGLEAYRKFNRDAGTQVWHQLSQIDRDGVNVLIDELERIVKNGKLRSGRGPEGNHQS
jgi:hypothetical protein